VAVNANRQRAVDLFGEDNLVEKWQLGAAEHCPDCLALAAQGWVPVGTLPPIGTETQCGDSCKCTIVIDSSGRQAQDGQQSIAAGNQLEAATEE